MRARRPSTPAPEIVLVTLPVPLLTPTWPLAVDITQSTGSTQPITSTWPNGTFGFALTTAMSNEPAANVPSSSVAVAVIDRITNGSALLAYTCVTDDGLPETTCTVPSPQLIVQLVIASAPGSLLALSPSVYAGP